MANSTALIAADSPGAVVTADWYRVDVSAFGYNDAGSASQRAVGGLFNYDGPVSWAAGNNLLVATNTLTYTPTNRNCGTYAYYARARVINPNLNYCICQSTNLTAVIFKMIPPAPKSLGERTNSFLITPNPPLAVAVLTNFNNPAGTLSANWYDSLGNPKTNASLSYIPTNQLPGTYPYFVEATNPATGFVSGNRTMVSLVLTNPLCRTVYVTGPTNTFPVPFTGSGVIVTTSAQYPPFNAYEVDLSAVAAAILVQGLDTNNVVLTSTNYTGGAPAAIALNFIHVNKVRLTSASNFTLTSIKLAVITDTNVDCPTLPPTAFTLPATAVSNSLATLNGTVNPNGNFTTAWFEWDVAGNNYTHQTAPVGLNNDIVSLPVSSSLTGLTPGVLYHGRVVATNYFGVVRGSGVLFSSPVLVLNGDSVVSLPTNSIFLDPGANGAPLAIAANGNHSLALRTDGSVIAWGNNAFGQTNVSPGATNVISIAAGSYHSLALRADGSIIGWGNNADGQVVAPASATNVVAIAGGANHSLALRMDGVVLNWGDNHFGQTNQPAGLSNIVAIAASGVHNVALKGDGTVVVWGYKYTVETNVPPGLTNVIAIAAGGNHSLALRADGTIVAWGYNNNGQTNVPAGLINMQAVAAGGTHSLALQANGSATAWGNNASGQATPPVNATGGLSLAGGTSHSLMLKSDGTVIGWGTNNYGQITIPSNLTVSPALVSGTLNLAVPGVYVLTYTVTNALGGVSTVTRTVIVGTVASLPSVLKGATRLGNGSFQFSFTNQSGANFSVFASTNLALPINTWSNLGPAVEAPSGQFQFTDPQATNNALRFYRVRSP